MSNDTGDPSSRFSDALDEIFSGAHQPSSAPAQLDQSVPDDAAASDDEVYELPAIIPATSEPASDQQSIEPRLPDRSLTPEPATAVLSAAETASTQATAPVQSAAPPTAPVAEAPATAWADHMVTSQPSPAGQLRAPGRRPRVRRVTRVLRHIDPWSTFKVAVIFNAVAYLVCLTSGVLLWRVADSTGTLDNVERWFTQFGWETFELKGGEVFHNAWIIGLFGAVAATGAAVLIVTLFNLVSDIVGGVRMTVLEEEVVERTVSSTRRYVVRRPADSSATGAVAASDWSTDDLDDDAPSAPAKRPDLVSAGGDTTSSMVTREVPSSNGPPGREDTDGAPTADWSVD